MLFYLRHTEQIFFYLRHGIDLAQILVDQNRRSHLCDFLEQIVAAFIKLIIIIGSLVPVALLGARKLRFADTVFFTDNTAQIPCELFRAVGVEVLHIIEKTRSVFVCYRIALKIDKVKNNLAKRFK